MSRKSIKEESRCKDCDNVTEYEKFAYFCDGCGKLVLTEFQDREDVDDFLTITVHNSSGRTEGHEYCSWRCCIKHLKTLNSDYFISMPFLHFDDVSKGTKASDFFALIKEDL